MSITREWLSYYQSFSVSCSIFLLTRWILFYAKMAMLIKKTKFVASAWNLKDFEQIRFINLTPEANISFSIFTTSLFMHIMHLFLHNIQRTENVKRSKQRERNSPKSGIQEASAQFTIQLPSAKLESAKLESPSFSSSETSKSEKSQTQPN